MSTTAIIILQYNNSVDTQNCIDSIEKYNSASIKYIVIDNGSTKKECVTQTEAYLRNKFSGRFQVIHEATETPLNLPFCTFFESSTNDGYAQGNNKAIALIYPDPSCENVLILNNDMLFLHDMIPTLCQQLHQTKECGIITPLIYGRDQKCYDTTCARTNPTAWKLILHFLIFFKNINGYTTRLNLKNSILSVHPECLQQERVPIELPSGSVLLFTKSVLQRIGALDPHTFLYYEENILYKKLKAIGYSNYLIPSCKCIHLGCSTTQHVKNTFLTRCMMNSAYYYLCHYEKLTWAQRFLLEIAKTTMTLALNLKQKLK